MNEALHAIARRRSCRQFRREQIGETELHAIIDAALQAPSGHNDQSWYLAVVQNAGLIQEMSDGSKAEMQKLPIPWMADLGRNEKYNIYYQAPTVIVVAAKADAVSPLADVCAAIENMLIAAESLEIGSCWIGFTRFYFNDPDKYAKLGIPEGYEVHYGVALGYKVPGVPVQPPLRKYERYFHIIP